MNPQELKLEIPGAARVRMAPSPTGFFHIGSARTALFNYLFAKASQGVFVLRIEDTDRERSKPVYEDNIIESLKWLGIKSDEGPVVGGKHGPYRQSERKEIYAKYIKKLLNENKAYYCFCSEEELEAQREYQLSTGRAPRYSGKCANLSEQEIEENLKEKESYVVRFNIAQNSAIGTNDFFTILTSGNVGIGTASPAGALEILHSSGETLILNKTTTEPTLKFIGDAGNDFTITIAGTNLRVANDDGTTSLLEIEQGGNVGIGDTNPDVLLHVTGGLGVDGALVLESTGLTSGFTTQQVQIRADSRDTNGGQLIFSTDTTGGVLTDHMVLTRDGNVGIGTASPDTKLHVYDTKGTSALKVDWIEENSNTRDVIY